MKKQAMQLLVDGSAGIYAYHSLVNRYLVYVFGAHGMQRLSEWMKTRADFDYLDLDNIFHPDNGEWCENIDYLTITESLYVYDTDTHLYWFIESIDGDIWAIHPEAEWNDTSEQWELKQ